MNLKNPIRFIEMSIFNSLLSIDSFRKLVTELDDLILLIFFNNMNFFLEVIRKQTLMKAYYEPLSIFFKNNNSSLNQ